MRDVYRFESFYHPLVGWKLNSAINYLLNLTVHGSVIGHPSEQGDQLCVVGSLTSLS